MQDVLFLVSHLQLLQVSILQSGHTWHLPFSPTRDLSYSFACLSFCQDASDIGWLPCYRKLRIDSPCLFSLGWSLLISTVDLIKKKKIIGENKFSYSTSTFVPADLSRGGGGSKPQVVFIPSFLKMTSLTMFSLEASPEIDPGKLLWH